MSIRCIDEPVSWLRLERFRLGELAATEHARVAGHLAACAACAACAASIEADDARDLPAVVAPEARGRRPLARILWAGAGALAVAAAMILAVGRPWRTPALPGAAGHTSASAKGDGMAFVLVRDDGQRVVEAQGTFRETDRFKALVTCPPSMNATFDLVVFDPSGPSFPLAPARGVSCGNEVPLPGAFRLSGDATETVCVVWRDAGDVDRAGLSLHDVAADRRAMCKELRSATGQ